MITTLQRRYDEHATNAAYLEKLDQLFTTQPCPIVKARGCGRKAAL